MTSEVVNLRSWSERIDVVSGLLDFQFLTEHERLHSTCCRSLEPQRRMPQIADGILMKRHDYCRSIANA